MEHEGNDCSSSRYVPSVLQDSAFMDVALDSETAAATVRKVAKLSSEAGGSGKCENCLKLPHAIVASSNMMSQICILQLCSSHFGVDHGGLNDISRHVMIPHVMIPHVMIPLPFHLTSLKMNLFSLIIS